MPYSTTQETAPNTPAVLETIQSMMQALQLNGSAAYTTVKIGIIKDVTDVLPALEITGADDQTERESMNQIGETVLVADQQVFVLTSIIDLADADTAEISAAQHRDLVTQSFHSSVHLNSTPGVIGVWLENNGKYANAFRNGEWYRIHQLRVLVRYDYHTTLQN